MNSGGWDEQKDFFYLDMVTLPYPGSKFLHLGIEQKQMAVQINGLENQNANSMQFWLLQVQFLSPSCVRFLTRFPVENGNTRKEDAE
jgi:hypothetical protein